MFNNKLELWLESPYVDDELKRELEGIKKIEHEVEDRFFKELEFGTGGMRGKIGAGSNRINIVTVGKATQGISDYINEKYKNEKKSVAIAYDSRNMSKEFAEKTATVFAANNIEVYLFESLRPTPELSFAVRHFKCKAGVVITASHNPPEYNGYKVYDEFGGQVVKDADLIIEKIDSINLENIKSTNFENNNNIHIIGEDVDTEYINKVKELSLNNDRANKELNIVYTPLHGTGNMLVRRVLKELGYLNVSVVSEQENPDPNFSTVKSPNPEEISSFDLAIKKAKEINAEIIIGTDPDCDRVGLVVKNKDGEYVGLNGNQTGALLLYYTLSSLRNKNILKNNSAIVKTIVTSELGRKIAEKYDVKTFDTLTGFKYIAELMQKFEDNKEYNFVFGYEESYGYLMGTFVRDKDAVIASMLICEMAAYYKNNNKTILDVLDEIYQEFGYFIEETTNITFAGVTGLNKMKKIMENFRENKLTFLAGKRVITVEDYKMSISLNLNNGKTEAIKYPKSDVIKFNFEDGSWIVLRPSGTEPKLKVYLSINEKEEISAMNILERTRSEILTLINRIQTIN